jgi:DNA-binding transcriptional ArsR family regulator
MLNHMVARKKSLDAAFHALAHPTRRAMLALLAEGERTVGELAAPFRVSLAASSKHLAVLERAGLVRRRIEGRTHTCRIDPEPLAEVAEWTARYRKLWEASFRRLDGLLDELKTLENDRKRRKK